MEESRQEIIIRHKYEINPETFYLSVSFIAFIFVLVLVFTFFFFYFLQPAALFSPPYTVGSFLSTFSEKNQLVVGDLAQEEEKEFISAIIDTEVISEQDSPDALIIGVISSFSNPLHSELLQENDAIIYYDAEKNSFYIYARDIGALKMVVDLISEDKIAYSSVRINDGVVEELKI